MPSSPSTSLRLELMSPGDKANTWGTVTNDNLGKLLEQAICGYTTVNIGTTDHILTPNLYTVDEARSAVLNITSGTLTTSKNIIAPAVPKMYIVKNSTSGGQAIVFKTSVSTGITIPNGKTALLYYNGSDFEQVVPYYAETAGTATTATTATNATNATNVTGIAGLLGYSVAVQPIAYTGVGGPQVMGSTANAAMMTFHRAGIYAVNFGLDTDNVLKVGGYSMGGVAYPVYHGGNLQTTAVTQVVATNNTTIATTAFAKLTALGWGQTWQNPSRTTGGAGNNYTNLTGKPIFVVIIGYSTSGSASVMCNDIIVGIMNSSTAPIKEETVAFVVPPGSSYGMVGGTISHWSELR